MKKYMNTRRKDISYWLRWFAVLPGGLLGAFISAFPLHWLILILFSNRGGDVDAGTPKFFISLLPEWITGESIEYLLYPFVMAIFFVICGAEIAPERKVDTAKALVITYLIFWGCIAAYTFLVVDYGNLNMQLSGRTLLAPIGAIMGLIKVRSLVKKHTSTI